MSVVIICGTKCALHSILEFHLLERYILDICTAPGEQKRLQIEITFLSSLHLYKNKILIHTNYIKIHLSTAFSGQGH